MWLLCGDALDAFLSHLFMFCGNARDDWKKTEWERIKENPSDWKDAFSFASFHVLRFGKRWLKKQDGNASKKTLPDWKKCVSTCISRHIQRKKYVIKVSNINKYQIYIIKENPLWLKRCGNPSFQSGGVFFDAYPFCFLWIRFFSVFFDEFLFSGLSFLSGFLDVFFFIKWRIN